MCLPRSTCYGSTVNDTNSGVDHGNDSVEQMTPEVPDPDPTPVDDPRRRKPPVRPPKKPDEIPPIDDPPRPKRPPVEDPPKPPPPDHPPAETPEPIGDPEPDETWRATGARASSPETA